ncbi:hypothetical protein [Halorubrum sp. DTA98]|uniref:hypothetical protein n=1 Tax=Halorubrum sp. DTA98 TaxID=3402163 RepID=UPI003AAF761D
MTQVQTRRETSPTGGSTPRESPYPRENYFASVDGAYDFERETLDESTHLHVDLERGTSKDEWILKQLWSDRATMLCPFAMFEEPDRGGSVAELFAWLHAETVAERAEVDGEPWAVVDDAELYGGHTGALHRENRQVVLTAPSEYTPPSPYLGDDDAAPSAEWRVNPEHGYLVLGGVARDLSKEELLGSFEEIVDGIETDPLDREIADARRLVRQLKTTGGYRDIDILTYVIGRLTAGESVAESSLAGAGDR